MTLDQLETFMAIADEGGLRAASKVLNKTQPTLSTGIKNLEEYLGIQLLDRSSYRVQLTDEGQILYTKISNILSQVKELEALAFEMNMGRETKLKLAIDYLSPIDLFLKILSQFREKNEFTQLEIDFEILGGSLEKLINGDANIAITPFIKKDTSIEYEKICELNIIPVISKKLVKKELDLVLQETPQIVVKDSAKKDNQDFAKNSQSNIWTVSDHMIKKELILNGFGWGHLEESSISKELKSKKMIIAETKTISVKTMPLFIARSKNFAYGPTARELWKFITSKI